MVSLAFSKSDEWIEDGHGALHLLSAAERYAILCDEVFCTFYWIMTFDAGLAFLSLVPACTMSRQALECLPFHAYVAI